MRTAPPEQFEMRAQLEGTLNWTCPHCAHLNRNKLTAGRWTVWCANLFCKRSYIFGLSYYRPEPGNAADRPGDPPDGIILDAIATDQPPTIADRTHDTEPMPTVPPQGYRKPFTPVHHAKP